MSPVSWGDIFTLPLTGDRIIGPRQAHAEQCSTGHFSASLSADWTNFGGRVDNTVSRRNLLKAIGTIGAAPILGDAAFGTADAGQQGRMAPSNAPQRKTEKADLVQLKSGGVTAAFDRRNGTLYSIVRDQDSLGTNFLGNSDNSQISDPHWTGDLVTTIWNLYTPE